MKQEVTTHYSKDVYDHQDEGEGGGWHHLKQRQTLRFATHIGMNGGTELWRSQHENAKEQDCAKSLCQQEDEQGQDGGREFMPGHDSKYLQRRSQTSHYMIVNVTLYNPHRRTIRLPS